jgi:hypothetical protein
MNSHSEIEEPRTAAELIARYRDVRRRLYSPGSPPKLVCSETRTDSAACKAIATIPLPSRQPEPRLSETPFQYQTPPREALRAVSTRTQVPIADILGRNRRPPAADRRRSSRGGLARPPRDGLVTAALGKVLQTRSHDCAALAPRDGEALGPRSRSAHHHELPVITTDLRGSDSLELLRFPVRAVVCEPGKRRRQARLPLAPVAPTRGCRGAPARSARPCSATASRSAAGQGAK